MEKVLNSLEGKRVEVNCGRGIVFAGDNQGVTEGVLRVKDDHGKVFMIDVEKVIAVCETVEQTARPGFLGR